MIEHIGGNPAAAQPSFSSFFKTISVLRVGAGVLLLTSHGWKAGLAAYEFLWQEKPWIWVSIFSDAGLPWPVFMAPAAAIILVAVALSWTVGFLTRLFSLVMLPVAAAFVFFAHRTDSPFVEVGWLYMLIAFTLLLYGSGALSLDKLFHLGEEWSNRPKKKKNW